MELRGYLEILLRRKWIVILFTIVSLEIAAVGSSLMTPVYSASTLVRISTFQESGIEFVSLAYSERVMNTNVQLLKSRPFLEEVIQRLELKLSPTRLAKQIEIEPLPNTELLEITAEAENPIQAVDIADMLGALLVEEKTSVYFGQGQSTLQKLEEQLTIVEDDLLENRALLQQLLDEGTSGSQAETIQDLDTRIRIQEETYAMLLNEYDRTRIAEGLRANSVSIIEPALAPSKPSKPNLVLNSILGGILGMSAGVAVAFLVDNLDTTINTAEDLQAATSVPMLGWIPKVPRMDKSEDGRLIPDSQARSPASEAFRMLRANVVSLTDGKSSTKSLLVTSAEPHAGKSTIVTNLAVAISQGGRKVVVVDSDMGQPSLHEIFGLSNSLGLSSVLSGASLLDPAIQETQYPGLEILTSGPLPSPSEIGALLDVSKLDSLIEDLAKRVDFIILDSSPLLAIADAAVIAPVVDGVLLVAARRESTANSIQQALQQLELVGANVIGTVMNKSDSKVGHYYVSEYRRASPRKRSITNIFRRSGK